MGLITCNECGNEISDKANVCPRCGCPIEYQVHYQEHQAKVQLMEAEKEAERAFRIEHDIVNDKLIRIIKCFIYSAILPIALLFLAMQISDFSIDSYLGLAIVLFTTMLTLLYIPIVLLQAKFLKTCLIYWVEIAILMAICIFIRNVTSRMVETIFFLGIVIVPLIDVALTIRKKCYLKKQLKNGIKIEMVER